MKRVPMCDENCFECKFDDCIADILPKERERQRLYYQKHWEEKALNQFIEKQYGISNVNWLTSKQAAKLIEGLKSIWEKDKRGQ